MRNITIKPALNGYICTVGCQTVVFHSREKLLEAFTCYLVDPDRLESEYLKNALNPMREPCPQQPADLPGQGRNPVLRRDPCPPPTTVGGPMTLSEIQAAAQSEAVTTDPMANVRDPRHP